AAARTRDREDGAGSAAPGSEQRRQSAVGQRVRGGPGGRARGGSGEERPVARLGRGGRGRDGQSLRAGDGGRRRDCRSEQAAPRHVGVITDCNRRWAREFGATTADGHRAGAAKIVEVLGWCFEIDVEIVTLYVLSKENLARSAEEVSILIEIISDLVEKIAALDGVGVQLVGDLEIVPADLRSRLEAVTTDSDCGMRVNVAVGYGGRQEIVNAVRSLLRARNDDGTDLETIISELSPEQIGEHLYTKGQPDPDL